MKKMFKLSILAEGKNTEKEVIADTQGDAVINAIQTYGKCVIEVTPIPYDTMTTAQKIRVIDADWESHERNLRTQKTEQAMNESFNRVDEIYSEFFDKLTTRGATA